VPRQSTTDGQSRTRVVSFSAGAGLGVERVWFAPIGAAASVAPAAADAFWTGTARLAIAVALRVTPTLVIGARVACDVAAAEVHYDLYDASGVPHRVLTERRVAPQSWPRYRVAAVTAPAMALDGRGRFDPFLAAKQQATT
jgi:hypothetical protein